MDYTQSDVWARLAQALETDYIPCPAGDYGRVHCEDGWAWRPRLTDYDLWLVLDGRGRAVVAGQEVTLGPATLFVLRPGDEGQFEQDPHDRLHVMYCHFEFTDPRTREPLVLPPDLSPPRCLQDVDLTRMHTVLHRLISLRRDPHPMRQWQSRGALGAVLAEVYLHESRRAQSGPKTVDTRVIDLLDYVADNLHRRPSLGEVAEVVSLSRARTSRLFAEQVGMSLRSYQLKARLDRARVLVLETSMSVTDVSRALGYRDPFLLSRQFAQRFGQSPSQLRASVQEVDR